MAELAESTEEVTEEVTEDVAPVAEETVSEETTSEAKAEDATGDAGDSDAEDTGTLLSDDESDGAEGVPDKYEFTLPEGVEVEITDRVQSQLDAFHADAKDIGLSQAQVDRLVAGEFKRGQEALQQGANGYQQRVSDWATETKADKELGGDDLAKNLSVAKLGMETFGTPELKQLFDKPSPENPNGLGIGNHPEIIRLLHRAGLQVREDGDLVGGDGGKAESDASLRRMYPSMFKDEAAA
jgi:hypothetical protein